MKIIGMGHGGGSIAKMFNEYLSYDKKDIFLLDTEEHSCYNTFLVPRQNDEASYQDNMPSIKGFIPHDDRDTVLCLAGSGKLSGAFLRVLEELTEIGEKVSVIYVRPDLNLLSNKQLYREDVTFNVLQEFVRSGRYDDLYLFDCSLMESMMPQVDISNYYHAIDSNIVYAFHSITAMRRSSYIFGNLDLSDCPETSRIKTFGIVDITTGQEKLFFDLETPFVKEYYFNVGGDVKLKKKEILDVIQTRKKLRESIMYGVYCLEGFSNRCYTVHSTGIIQNEEILKRWR